MPGGELARRWRTKFPGAYDDLDDPTLERKVLAKYPEYSDLADPQNLPPLLVSSHGPAAAGPRVFPQMPPLPAEPVRSHDREIGADIPAVMPSQQPLAPPIARTPIPDPRQFEPRTLLDVPKDAAISLLKGAIGLPEAAVGLADIPTLGYAGLAAERLGFKPKEARQGLDSFASPAQQAANQNVQHAQGILPTIKAVAQNPSTIVQGVLESAPSMIGAGGVARGGMAVTRRFAPAVARRLPGWLAGAFGEGVFTAGQQAEQVRQATPDGRLTPRQAGIATGSGLLTGMVTGASGKVAQWLKIADAQTMLATGKMAASQDERLSRALILGALQEGALEEFPQSVQEQVAQNIALNKPAWEGVPQAAVLGFVTGAVMGGGATVVNEAGSRLNAGQVAREVSGSLQQNLEANKVPGPPRLVKQTPATDYFRNQAIEADATTRATTAQETGMLEPRRGEAAVLEPMDPELGHAAEQVRAGKPVVPFRVGSLTPGTRIVRNVGTPDEQTFTVTLTEGDVRRGRSAVWAADEQGHILQLVTDGKPGPDLSAVLDEVYNGQARVDAPSAPVRQTPGPDLAPPLPVIQAPAPATTAAPRVTAAEDAAAIRLEGVLKASSVVPPGAPRIAKPAPPVAVASDQPDRTTPPPTPVVPTVTSPTTSTPSIVDPVSPSGRPLSEAAAILESEVRALAKSEDLLNKARTSNAPINAKRTRRAMNGPLTVSGAEAELRSANQAVEQIHAVMVRDYGKEAADGALAAARAKSATARVGTPTPPPSTGEPRKPVKTAPPVPARGTTAKPAPPMRASLRAVASAWVEGHNWSSNPGAKAVVSRVAQSVARVLDAGRPVTYQTIRTEARDASWSRQALDHLVERGHVERVWGQNGEVYYAKKGQTKPAGFLRYEEVPDDWLTEQDDAPEIARRKAAKDTPADTVEDDDTPTPEPAGEPVTVESIQRTFGVSKKVAKATHALYAAMGLDAIAGHGVELRRGGTPAKAALFSVKEWEAGKRKWARTFGERARELGWDQATVDQATDMIQGVIDVFKAHRSVFPQHRQKGVKAALRSSADFKYTFDINRTCMRVRKFWSTVRAIEGELRTPMNEAQLIRLGQMMRQDGDLPGCNYCYVEAARRANQRNAVLFIKARAGDPDLTPGIEKNIPVRDRLLRELGWGAKKFAGWVTRPDFDEAAAQKDPGPQGELWRLYNMYVKYGGGTLITGHTIYEHKILNMAATEIADINDRAGMRWQSATDLDPTQIAERLKGYADSSVRGLAGHEYAKEPYTVLIFGDTGIKQNLSVALNKVRGKFVSDDVNGMPLDLALKLRDEYKNAGTMLMAKNLEQLRHGLSSADIDMIIPHHAAYWSDAGYRAFGMDDFGLQQGSQHEAWLDPEGHAKSPKETFGNELWLNHYLKANDGDEAAAVKAYLQFCADKGIRPKWAGGIYIDHVTGDTTTFPDLTGEDGYVKLLKDYARTDSPQVPLDISKVNGARMQEFLDGFVEQGGWTARDRPNAKTVDRFVDLVRSHQPMDIARAEQLLLASGKRASIESSVAPRLSRPRLDRELAADRPRRIGLTVLQQLGPKAGEILGSTEFTDDGQAIVRGFEQADASTGIHELAHVARRFLFDPTVPAEDRRGITDEQIATAEAWAGAEDGAWSREAEEKFARGFERYLREGKSPTAALAKVFAAFRSFLSEIYQKIRGSAVDVQLSPEMRRVFDALVSRGDSVPAGKTTTDVSAETATENLSSPATKGQQPTSAEAERLAAEYDAELAAGGSGVPTQSAARLAPAVASPSFVQTAKAKLPVPVAQRLGAHEQLRPSEIIKRLSALFSGIPVNEGRYRQRKWALGIYKPKAQTIRMKVAGDVETAAHEFGHHVDLAVMGMPTAKQPYTAELMQLGALTSKPSYSASQVRTEGAAEFFRLYLSDPAGAQAQAPQYFAAFEAKLVTMPTLQVALQEAQRQIQGWMAQDPADRAKARINFHGVDPKEGGSFSLRAETAWVDDLAAIRRMTEDLADGHPLDARQDGYVLARLTRGAVAKADGFLRHGVRDRSGQRIADSFESAIAPVRTRLRDFATYLAALRAVELRGRDIEPGMTMAEAQGAITKYQSAAFDQARDAVYEYQDALLEYAKESGALSDDQVQKIRALNQYYVPFQRVRGSVEGQSGGGIANRFANRGLPVKRIKGSGWDIVNPLESIVQNTHAIVDMVEKNRAMQQLVRQATKAVGGGRYIEEIPQPKVATRFNLQQLTKEITGALQSGMGIQGKTPWSIQASLDEMVTVFTPATFTSGKDGIISVIEDGKRTFYQVNDQPLYDAITMMGTKAPDMVVNLFMRPARLLRAGATLTLGFAARNVARDTFSAAVNSRYGFRLGYDTLAGLFEYLKAGEHYQAFLNSGGANSALVAIDRDKVREYLSEMGKSRTRVIAQRVVLNPVELLRALSEASENATRLGEFMRAIAKEGAGESALAKAGLAARDVTIDFGRGGTQSKAINQYVPFFNAGVQGNVRIAEVFRKDPVGATTRAALAIMVPSILLWFLNKDNDEYRELPAWEKNTYWHVPLGKGNGFVKVPKPFELGNIFGNVPEAALDYLAGKDPKIVARLMPNAGTAWETLLSVLIQLTPALVKPVFEVVANRDTFRDRTIIAPSDERLDPELQFGRWTSETAKAVAPQIGMSPAVFDHLVYGYTAGLGRGIVWAIDQALPADAPKPDGGPARWPLVGAFYRDEVGAEAQSLSDFYALRDHLQGAKDSVRRYHEAGESDRVNARRQEILAEHPKADQLLKDITAADKVLKDYRGRVAAIFKDRQLDGDAKREQLGRLYEAMINVARKALGKDKLPPRFEGGALPKPTAAARKPAPPFAMRQAAR